MKKTIFKFVLGILIGLSSTVYSQITISTSDEPSKDIKTEQDKTEITLFSIDYNGKEVPFSIVALHSGLKVNDPGGVIGRGWEIAPWGLVDVTVNGIPDAKPTYGWFYSSLPDLTSSQTQGDCASCQPQSSYTGADISPDYYRFSSALSGGFEFTYDKSSGNQATPAILSNDNGWKIVSNFSQFNANCNAVSGTPLVIYDSEGQKFEFVNGPVLHDLYRGNECRSDMYVKRISNATTNEVIELDYTTIQRQRTEWYFTGFNQTSQNSSSQVQSDFQNGVVRDIVAHSYVADISRLEIARIETNALEINFGLVGDLLDNIEISDKNGNVLRRLRLLYVQNDGGAFLDRIQEESPDGSQFATLYKFDYYFEGSGEYYNQEGDYQDFFGFNNGQMKSQFHCPFQYRDATVLHDADDFSPKLAFARIGALKEITNKYSGTISFEYELNYSSHWYYGELYAGGLRLSKKTVRPVQSKATYYSYGYDEIVGYPLQVNDLISQYSTNTASGSSVSKRYWAGLFECRDIHETGWTSLLPTKFQSGSYARKVTEAAFEEETDEPLYIIEREYTQNYEGTRFSPLLKFETYFNPAWVPQKRIEYSYSYVNLKSIPAAFEYTVKGQSSEGGTIWIRRFSNSPIPINRNRISSITTKEYDDVSFIQKVESRSYVNSTNIIRTKSVASPTETVSDTYYYPGDAQCNNEPEVTKLRDAHLIGIPLISEYRRGTSLIKTDITKYKDWGNGLLSVEKEQRKFFQQPEFNIKSYICDSSTGKVIQEKEVGSPPKVFVWGYRNSQIIAEIVNASWSQVSSLLGTVVSLSDTDTDSCMLSSCSEQQLRDALSVLRSNLPTAMVSTATYDLYKGMTSQTDPRGDTLYYEYDFLGQLVRVRDNEQRVLKSYTYNINFPN